MKKIKRSPDDIRLDMHVHTSFSPDSTNDIFRSVGIALGKGLSGFAVCDHGKAVSSDALREMMKEQGAEEKYGVVINPKEPCADAFYLIGGCEIAFGGAHVTGLFLDRTEDLSSKNYGSFEEICSFIRSAGGIAVIAHPFEHRRPGEEPPEDLLCAADGIESFNSRADYKYPTANERAASLAKEKGSFACAGSDAHFPPEIGRASVSVSSADGKYPSFEELKKLFLAGGKLSSRTRSERRRHAQSAAVRRIRQKKPLKALRSLVLYVMLFAKDVFYPVGKTNEQEKKENE